MYGTGWNDFALSRRLSCRLSQALKLSATRASGFPGTMGQQILYRINICICMEPHTRKHTYFARKRFFSSCCPMNDGSSFEIKGFCWDNHSGTTAGLDKSMWPKWSRRRNARKTVQWIIFSGERTAALGGYNGSRELEQVGESAPC